ncbi:MAG: hypothetical protein MK161_13650 [Pirellulales bacterium]|nr:hypothetical protein [Pirellulales bacterium]
MKSVTEGLDLDVDRGPNWLFVKLQPSRRAVPESPHVADEVWSISKRHFVYRLVLDLEQLESFPEGMMGQIALLQERLVRQGGALRLCGLSPACEAVVQECQLDKALPNHASREDAVLGEPTAGTASLDKPALVTTAS